MKTIKIKPKDDEIKIDLNLTLQEVKALYNLLIEVPVEMVGYRKTATKLLKKIKA